MSIRNYHVASYLGVNLNDTPKYWVAFIASAPPLGFSTYILSYGKGAKSTRSSLQSYKKSRKSTFNIGPDNLKLTFSTDGAKQIHYSNSKHSVEENVDISYSYYASYSGTINDTQASGAYIFRPNGTYEIKPDIKSSLRVVRGPLIEEVHQRINSWMYQTTRLNKGKDHVEVEYALGPIPIHGDGKEVVTKFTTAMKTNKTFYTDSNGRDFIKRIRDYRTDWKLQVNEPVAGNYYPLNLGMYMHDDKREFSVLVDRAMGGASLLDGQLELMLHRRLLKDDDRGVEEALNEMVCINDKCKGLQVVGKLYFKIDALGEGAKWRRTLGQEIYSPFLLAFSEQQEGDKWLSTHVTAFSGINPSYTLPDNVAILTLQELADGKVLLRLAHLYEVGEDKDLSGLTKVELKKLFPHKKIGRVVEMSLSANQERAEMEKKRLKWKVQEVGRGVESSHSSRGRSVDPEKLIVELAPMEIRTFHVQFSNENSLV